MEKLGIDSFLIAVQIINFGLLLYVLKRVLYKPVLKAIAARQKKIAAIDKEKQKFEKQKEEFEKKTQKLLRAMRKEKQEIVEEAKKEATTQRKETLEKANYQAKEIIKKAKLQVEKEKLEALKQVNQKSSKLAIVIVEKMMGDILSKSAKKKSVQLAIKQLERLSKENGN